MELAQNSQKINGVLFFQDIFQIIDSQSNSIQKSISQLLGQQCQIEIIEKGLQNTEENQQNSSNRHLYINSIILQQFVKEISNYKQSFDVFKIKENMGIKQWVIDNYDIVYVSILKTYQCLILLCFEHKYVIIDYRGTSPIEIKRLIQFQSIQSDIVFVFLQNDLEIDYEEINQYIKLQRIFQNNYLLSLKYFPFCLFQDLKDFGIYIIESFFDIKSENGITLNSELFEKLIEIEYDFDKYTTVLEQNYISSSLSEKEVSEVIQNIFSIENAIISEQVVNNLGNILQIYCGIQESICEQSTSFYFYENSQLIMRDEIQEIQKDIVNIILSSLDGSNFQVNLKEVKTQFGIQKKLQKKRGNKQYYNYIFVLNLKQCQQNLDLSIHDENWVKCLQPFDILINEGQFLSKLNLDYEQANSEFKMNKMLQNEIPVIVELMTEISNILGEPIQQDESEILSSCLNKIFVLNLI